MLVLDITESVGFVPSSIVIAAVPSSSIVAVTVFPFETVNPIPVSIITLLFKRLHPTPTLN